MVGTMQWEFWVDRGGTFTDVVAVSPEGGVTSHKYLSVNPTQYEDAAVFAMRDIMAVPKDAPFPSDNVRAIKMGTTVATNALLEREGARTLFVVTKGFADVLRIGQQHRADLFALKPTRPEPLYNKVLEVSERIDAHGKVMATLDQNQVKQDLIDAKAAGFESVAIAFVHGYRHQAHENAVATIAKNVGFEQVSVSHQVSPLMKLVPRGDTTVADAYLSPILRLYVEQVRHATGGVPLYFMQSNGGLALATAFEGKDAVLSGPAGGIVGAAKSAARENHDRIVGFDMGGTSTDVSHYAGTFERVFDTVVAGVRMTVPMMDIHTVAAGGGSVCRFAEGRFQVGPQSAGAMPGPAAYGKNGPITVTDCNVLLGKIKPHLFPSVFGESGNEPLNVNAVKRGFEQIADDIATHTSTQMSLEAIAEGFLKVAVEHMARAIKRVSIERGHNVKDYSLLTFGGAGGQHACLVADALGIETVLVPPFSGVLSALGMGLAEQRFITEKALEVSFSEYDTIKNAINEATQQAMSALATQGVARTDQRTELTARIKYAGTDTTLPINFGSASAMQQAFEAQHLLQFGFVEPDTALVVESVEAEAISNNHNETAAFIAEISNDRETKTETFFSEGRERNAQALHRDTMLLNQSVTGPAIIIENGGTTIVEPGWSAERTKHDSLVLKRLVERKNTHNVGESADPILLEIFNNLFMSVAEEMGGVLAKTAHSVNVKERLDFSCAVFDSDGNLIANAPHMPVHLGSMGDSVAAIIDGRGATIKRGDVFMVNDPSAGGTHLPDITVVTPVFLADQEQPAFYVASRGHHADVGGITPGSMPPHSKTLEDEGICFTNFHLVDQGHFRTDAVRNSLLDHPYPARNTDQNIADLKAQVAANARGVKLVEGLVTYYGLETVNAYMGFVRENAASAVRRVISRIETGQYSYQMDCGAVIKVAVVPDKENERLTIDFTGSSPALDNNYNAPFAVVKAAVLYVFRVLAGGNIPLNAGCLEPIDIIAPEGSMLRAPHGSAVVAGNVETSQAITNALFLATNTLAGAQGTMNNLTFGNAQYQYYETIAGGTGAGPGFDGTSAIHSHMTNSRLTDVEVMEWRYPIIVHQFGVRQDNTGSSGKYKGGNGVIREIEFLEEMEVSLLANHYIEGAPGLNGGDAGTPGSALIIKANNTKISLSSADLATVDKGDRILLKTPGGGGYGNA
ncbi:hydantoinase B/oxoprolinase family protein [Kordiimonas aquimaris]|uniref:hydantoinase B/oxoprolinase family protein n=1 Tax=Kordiimonas aquimaris TaxID=707591 RepID=UPI0021CE2E32|nr:hydantoinase B/oxoprolinase family protein [Kordiimonas aquimaris]